MRVLALVTDAFGGHGGIARYNRDLLTAMAASPMTTRIVSLPRHAEPTLASLPEKIEQTCAVPPRLAYALEATRLALSHPHFDLVFCGHLFQAPLGLLIARLLKVPFWLQLHGIEAWEPPRQIARAAARRADLVTSVSRYTRLRFLEWAGIDPSRVRVLPNTFDPRYTPGPKSPELLKRLGLIGRKIILTVSRLSALERYKGHDQIITVLPSILAPHPDALYLIVGDGDDRPRLEKLAEDCGVAGHVRFAGRVADEALLDYYRLADVFAMPSTGEGFGIVYLEAAATGLPVIAGNRDGSVDALADGAIGTLIDPHHLEQIASALISALSGPRRPIGSPERFSAQNYTAHVDALLRHLAR